MSDGTVYSIAYLWSSESLSTLFKPWWHHVENASTPGSRGLNQSSQSCRSLKYRAFTTCIDQVLPAGAPQISMANYYLFVQSGCGPMVWHGFCVGQQRAWHHHRAHNWHPIVNKSFSFPKITDTVRNYLLPTSSKWHQHYYVISKK